MPKPMVQLVGTDGNIFALMGKASAALKRAGQVEQAHKMQDEVTKSGSYDEALAVIMRYVEAY